MSSDEIEDFDMKCVTWGGESSRPARFFFFFFFIYLVAYYIFTLTHAELVMHQIKKALLFLVHSRSHTSNMKDY